MNTEEIATSCLIVGEVFTLPKDHVLKDENGNVINATKIVLEKKKKEYQKTYAECCKVLGFKPIHSLALQLVATSGFTIEDVQISSYERALTIKLEAFRKLLICRDAYWKIAGEEMGLGKPWEPEFGGEPYYCIKVFSSQHKVEKRLTNCTINCILAFPTEEMLDAFYENFKSEIEQCKELL